MGYDTDDMSCGCKSPSNSSMTGLRMAGSILSRNEFSHHNIVSFSACVCVAVDDGWDCVFGPSDIIFEPGVLTIFCFWLILVIVVKAIKMVD